jgi:hypothetical protein
VNWIQQQREQGLEREAAIAKAMDLARSRDFVDHGTDFKAYCDAGDEDFLLWMILVNASVLRVTGLGVYDHEDHLWRDAFDDGTGPKQAVKDWLEDSGIGAELGMGA